MQDADDHRRELSAMPEIEPLQPDAEKVRVQLQRAMDDAVMSMFELAFSLEALDEAIRRFNAETSRELRERTDAIIGVELGKVGAQRGD